MLELDLTVKRFKIKLHFADIFRLKHAYLKLRRHKTTQFTMIKNKIDLKILAANNNRILFPDKCEVSAKLKEKLSQITNNGLAQVFL